MHCDAAVRTVTISQLPAASMTASFFPRRLCVRVTAVLTGASMLWHVAMHQQACIPVLAGQPVPLESRAAWDPLLESTLSTVASSACSKSTACRASKPQQGCSDEHT